MRERRRLVERKLPLATVATGVGISERTARKWVKRFEAEGPAGLENRFSRPRMVANRTGEPCLAHLLVPEFETQQFLLAALAILWLAADSATLLSRSGALSNAPHASSTERALLEAHRSEGEVFLRPCEAVGQSPALRPVWRSPKLKASAVRKLPELVEGSAFRISKSLNGCWYRPGSGEYANNDTKEFVGHNPRPKDALRQRVRPKHLFFGYFRKFMRVLGRRVVRKRE
jgi:hypothetical protein